MRKRSQSPKPKQSLKAWRKENPLKYRVQNFMSSLRKTGKPVPERTLVLDLVTSHVGNDCPHCGQEMDISVISLDHSQPLSREGTNEIKNLCCMCQKCNRLKGEMTKDEFGRLRKFWDRPINTAMKPILIRRLGMSNAMYGRRW